MSLFRSRRTGRAARARLPRSFSWLFGAAAATNLADGIRAVALPLLAVELTETPALIAGLAVAQSALALVAGLPAGVLADRFDRRRIAVRSDLVQASLFVIVAAAVVVDVASIPLLYAAALGLGAAATVGDAAMATAVPALVDDDQLELANGRLVSVVFAAQQLVGPAVAGALFATAVVAPFGSSAGLAAVSAAAIARLPSLNRSAPAGLAVCESRAPDIRERAAHLLRDVREGIGFLAGHRLLRTVVLLAVVLTLTDAAWFAILVLFLRQELGQPAAAYGIVLAIAAVGGIGGGMVAGRVIARLGTAVVLRGGLVVIASAQLVLGLTSRVATATIALAVGNAGFAVWLTAGAALRQSLTPDAVLGRVSAAWGTAATGAGAVGAALGGIVAQLLGLRAPFLLGAPIVLATALLGRPVSRGAIAAARAAVQEQPPGAT